MIGETSSGNFSTRQYSEDFDAVNFRLANTTWTFVARFAKSVLLSGCHSSLRNDYRHSTHNLHRSAVVVLTSRTAERISAAALSTDVSFLRRLQIYMYWYELYVISCSQFWVKLLRNPFCWISRFRLMWINLIALTEIHSMLFMSKIR